MAALGTRGSMPRQLAALLVMPRMGQCGFVPRSLEASMFGAVGDGLEPVTLGTDPSPASRSHAGHLRRNRHDSLRTWANPGSPLRFFWYWIKLQPTPPRRQRAIAGRFDECARTCRLRTAFRESLNSMPAVYFGQPLSSFKQERVVWRIRHPRSSPSIQRTARVAIGRLAKEYSDERFARLQR